jgi:cyclopropane-fatty-acyl-phospholipid synthase
MRKFLTAEAATALPGQGATQQEGEALSRRGLVGLLDRFLSRAGIGRLRLSLPSGATAWVGAPHDGVEADLAIENYRAFWKLATRGALGFAEAFMEGDVDTTDLRRFFEFYYANEQAIAAALPRLNRTCGVDRRFHAARRNSRIGSRRNIAAHYDLGNAFYRLWLDESMCYSSGIYSPKCDSLEAAQQQKLRRIVAALDLNETSRVLEIGCGWGALALAMGKAGARVDAITISHEQHRETEARAVNSGLADKVSVRFEDYRDTTGRYDRIVSVEMIEAVGEENWPLYFETVARRLKPGGSAVIQAITIREDAFASYRANPDFIQRYIFPGGMLPTVSLMAQRAAEAGFQFETLERFGPSYARTLSHWRERFEAAWPRIAELGFDERFRRMWLYYLAYSETGFDRGLIDVGLYRLTGSAGQPVPTSEGTQSKAVNQQ